MGKEKTKGGLNMYSEILMDHFTNPRNVGEIKDADAVANVGNVVCGDTMRIYIKVKDDIIEDIKFKTFGCGAAIASSSIATEMVKGKTLDEALKITNKEIADALGGLPPAKVHCSVMAADAIKKAIEQYREKTKEN
ncbi:MAG: FeS cluster assembly scaffold protein NifU [Clostridia bacterium 41_269]|nr:MAG: FeS cluster assembly scaffold protein NifU [Clostridia bacterium 41_269]